MSQFEVLKSDVMQKFGDERFRFWQAHRNDVLEVPKDKIVEVLQFLKDSGKFDVLMDLCGVDYLGRDPRFEVVYHLFNSKNFQGTNIYKYG